MNSILIQADFDNTITEGNVSELIHDEFGPDDWPGINKKYKRDLITVEESNIYSFKHLNTKKTVLDNFVDKNVKFRENFRPLAPAVLKEKSKYYFKLNQEETPHMLQAIKVKKICYKETPAIIHKDGTARVQTVSKKLNMKSFDGIKQIMDHVLKNQGQNQKVEIISDGARTLLR